jgi:molybdopterin-guanine dinucleotide biosynthesis protein A
MTTRRITALVLAGGRSARFGRDKLAEPLDGRPMLDHAIEAVRTLATEILVVAAPGSNQPLPQGATLVHDPVAFEGPLAGVVAGLGAARGSIVLVIGGDMPTLVGAVIDSMLDALEAPGIDAVVLEHDGRARPLPLVLRRDPALTAASRLFTDGERRLRALPEALATATIPELTWRTLDPEGQTLRDIDTIGDLPAR